jgi:glycine dehydrogenase subunit 1
MGAMHMSLLGPDGITVLSKRVAATTETTKKALLSIEGVELLHPNSSNFREFVIKVPGDSEQAIAFMDSKGVIAGFPLGLWWESYSSCILVGCDERTTDNDISSLVSVVNEWINEVMN